MEDLEMSYLILESSEKYYVDLFREWFFALLNLPLDIY